LAGTKQGTVGIRAERQREGICTAQERGTRFGQRKRLTPKQVIELQARREGGALIKTLMTDCRLSKTSVYRYLKERVDGT
jgi:DNA invertase Pin-like site-specific DNA recombinase